MKKIMKRLVLALSFPLVLPEIREWWGRVAERFPGQEYRLPNDHSHSEDSRPRLGVQMATRGIAPPPISIPFVPNDDSEMYGDKLLPQRDYKTPYKSDWMTLE